ncbi:MAG TPA: BPSS1780 family membrane protein [Sideroxyarcus sp.]|nr:BPSS1780 family membrane protein [Sideroxyarcus sp.]
MEIKRYNAARGWIWVKQGYQLIMRNPLMSISFALIFALLMFVGFKVPLFGPLLLLLLMPVLMAGYMRACHALEEDEEVELAHLFEGFRKHTGRLVALGGFLMVGLLISSMAMVLIGGEALRTLLESANAATNPEMLMEAMWTAGSGVTLSLTVGFALLCLLMLAFQYAPMLVFFNDVMPFAALRASLAGSLRNIIPYTVYNLIMQVVAVVLGMLPFGIGLIVLLPLGLTSLYVSYRNIFPFAHELAAFEPVTPDTEA